MDLFTKEKPDIICHGCNYFFNHKKVKWKPREISGKLKKLNEESGIHDIDDENKSLIHIEDKEAQHVLDELQLTKLLGKIGKYNVSVNTATPNNIFGWYEFEYRSKCPKCGIELTAFWFGNDSIKKSKRLVGLEMRPKQNPFYCNECKQTINREFQFWYSVTIRENEVKIGELLTTICQNCNEENGYPFEYDLEKGVIE